MNSVSQYQKVQVMTSDGVRLIIMLYEGIINFNNCAKKAIAENDIEGRSNYLNRSLDIITELTNALNMDEGGQIAENLKRLYDFSVYALTNANRTNDPGSIDEVNRIFSELKAGWEGIASSEKGRGGNKVALETKHNGIAQNGL